MANAITKDEARAIEQFEARQQAAAEAELLANRSIEDIYIDAFTGYTEGTIEPPHIMEALATIAAFFHDDDIEFRTEDSDPNNCQFNQKGLMGNIVQQADWMLGREEKRIGYLRQQAARARRNHVQGEIDTMELEKAEIEYGRSKMVNVPILEDFKKAAKAAYLAQFGEDWTRPVKRDDRVTTEALDDRFAHSERRSRL